MRRNGILFAALALLLAGCAAEGGDAAPTRAKVDIRFIEYAPASVTVKAGGTVAWTNLDDVAHTVTPLDATQWGTAGSGDDEASWLRQGDSWSFAFLEPGTYRYRCIPHSYQDGATGEWRGQVGAVTVV